MNESLECFLITFVVVAVAAGAAIFDVVYFK